MLGSFYLEKLVHTLHCAIEIKLDIKDNSQFGVRDHFNKRKLGEK